LQPRWNIAPGQQNPVITKHSPNQISRMVWGLIPLKSRTYQTQNGETRFSNDVMISQFQFLGKRDGQGGQVDD
jgi:putative SOS response-associated peptidase YedK